MNAIKIVATVLVVPGFLGLLYGGFSYTRQTQEAKMGPIELSIQEKAIGQGAGLGQCGGNSDRWWTPARRHQEELTADQSRSALPARTTAVLKMQTVLFSTPSAPSIAAGRI
jgi:hypothetical protein